jgi:hypothetical protein
MDNCPSHLTSDVIVSLRATRAAGVIFAPHTTQNFQFLDSILFGIFKREDKSHLPFGNLETMAKTLIP